MSNQPTQDPESAARELFAALGEKRAQDVADFIHPHTVEAFKSYTISDAQQEQEHFETYVDHPDRIRPYGERTYWRSCRVGSVAELEALSPRELIVRHIEDRFTREPKTESPLPGVVPVFTYQVSRNVLGHVEESPDLAHIVYRVTVN